MKPHYIEENFKVLCAHTKEVARLYFKALSIIKGEVKTVNLLMENNLKKADNNQNEIELLYLEKIERAFRRLDIDSQKIINNDFFYNNYKFWWLDLYSTSTYYRLKRVALARFLDNLN